MNAINDEHRLLLQRLVSHIGEARRPFVETGRKFDKIIVEGKVRYFVARGDLTDTIKAGDIFGAKSKLAPNFRWYFGNIANVELWNWEDFHGKPINDKSVMPVKRYAAYTHYMKVPV